MRTKEFNFDFNLADGRKVNVDASVEYFNFNRYADSDCYPYDIGDTTLVIMHYKDDKDPDGVQLFKADIGDSDYTKLIAKVEHKLVEDYFWNKNESMQDLL